MRFCEANGCNYPVFSTDKITRKGYCKFHAPVLRTDLDKRTIVQKAMSKEKSKRIASKLRQLPKNIEGVEKMKEEEKELKEWFAYHMANSKKVCENCGKDLSYYNQKDWRGSQDHIIEKSKINGCPSVASVLENHCVLGKFCCHSQKHTSFLNLSKMDIFPVLKERFKKFENLIIEEERRKIPSVFLDSSKVADSCNP